MRRVGDQYTLDFERPLMALENQIEDLKELSRSSDGKVDISGEIKALQKKVEQLVKDIYSKLSTWDRVQLSRHPLRPHALELINFMIDDFHELKGDRYFANDQSVVAGLGLLGNGPIAVIAIEKGKKTKEKIQRNFGMPRPEGYRKAIRVMKLASRMNIPILSLVDTPGAYPGIGAEERGQSSAIAENLAEMFDLKSPFVSCIIGEGGSGGALGIAVADRVLMMEYSTYSVISPESCASILWSDPKMADVAANSLQLGPCKALELGVIDGIVPEPIGGGHRDPELTAKMLKENLIKEFSALKKLSESERLDFRFKKFRAMGNQTIGL